MDKNLEQMLDVIMGKVKAELTDLRYVDEEDWAQVKAYEHGYPSRHSDGHLLKKEYLHRLYHVDDPYPDDLDAAHLAVFDQELDDGGFGVGLTNSLLRSIRSSGMKTFGDLFFYYDFEVKDFYRMGKAHFDELNRILKEMGTPLRTLDKPHTVRENKMYAKKYGIAVEPCRMPALPDNVPENDAIRFYHTWFCERTSEFESSSEIPVWVPAEGRERILHPLFAEEAHEMICNLEYGITARITQIERHKTYQNRDPYLDADLKKLGMPGYAAHRLYWHGYETLRQLKEARLSEIRKVPGLGQRSYQTILNFLQEHEIVLPE